MSDRPRLVVAVGLPGSGKSTHFAAIGANPISTDSLRLLLTDDETDQTVNGRVFAIARQLVEQRLELGRAVTWVDATNLIRRDRKTWIALARKFNCRVEALWFDAPLSECKARNRARRRVVPETVLDLMAARFVPPAIEEGFDAVVRAGS